LAREWKTPHIFLSANRSFDSVAEVDGVLKVGDTLVSDWEKQIHYLLDKGFMVSLDYPAHKHELVLRALNPGIWQSRNFVPILSVAIPKVSTSSINLTIKIDDSNFAATNDGVWCLNHHEITDSNRFTAWSEYSDDMILSDAQITPTINPGPTGWTGPLEVKADKQPQANTEVRSMRKPVNLDDLIVGEEPKKFEMQDTESAFMGSLSALAKEADVKNDESLGLDPDSGSKLKPDPDAEATAKAFDVIDAASAAEAYAEGAKEDTLGKEASKKPVKAKK